MRSSTRKRHRLEPSNGMDMTPLIDVVFQLILFFMLTSSLTRPNQIQLDLPESSSGVKAQEEQSLVVSYRIAEGGPAILLNDKPVAQLSKLGEAMAAIAQPSEKPRVDIRIDKTVPYQEVISLMDTVRDAGFPKFSLQTLAGGSR
ncbi:MAG: biopolymer transporter ExbD [Planctomycetes bacterium]|nr:biopolymer transporter ExbD [Planctomycetota bacterium]